MQRHFSPKEGGGSAQTDFPKGAGVIIEGTRKHFRNILVVSANQFVSNSVRGALFLDNVVKTVPGFAEAETLIRAQGRRVGLLVLDISPQDALKLLDMAKKENPQLEAVVILKTPKKKGSATDWEAMRPFAEMKAAVVAGSTAMGKDPSDGMCIRAAIGSLASGPKTYDVFSVSSPA